MTLVINLDMPIDYAITLHSIDVRVNAGNFELPNLTTDMLQLLQTLRPEYLIQFKLT